MERKLSLFFPLIFVILTFVSCRMLAIAVICLTLGHPMFFFAPMMRRSKPQVHEKGLSPSTDEEARDSKSGSHVL